MTNNAIIQIPVQHFVKFEAVLCWPDGATRTPFTISTEVRLYEKATLQGLVDTCKTEGRPVTWHDVIDHSPDGHVAAATNDTTTGYFYFSEEGSEEDEALECLEFREIGEWPTAPTSYYVAVEGCAVVLPLTRISAIEAGEPVKHAVNSFADQYMLDPEQWGCLLEIEVEEKVTDGVALLEWRIEAAFAAHNGWTHDKHRAVLDPQWSYGATGPFPGETTTRMVSIPTIQVIPLLAIRPGQLGTGEGYQRAVWSHHQELSATLHSDVLDMFNLPADRPQLHWGLNVDTQGRPDRVQMFPKAVLDLTSCSSRAAVLDNVFVRFWEFGLRTRFVDEATEADLTLRRLAFNRTDAQQVPMGDAECLDANGASRLKLFDTSGVDVVSPIQPQYTANVSPGETLYEPLGWISGGKLINGRICEYAFRGIRRGGRTPEGSMSASYDNVGHTSWAPDVDAVRKLFYYHVDYFSAGGTPGIFSSLRVKSDGTVYEHRGLDLYAFCHYANYTQANATLKGEPLYALRRGRVQRRPGSTFKITYLNGDNWCQVDYMHPLPASAPGFAGLDDTRQRSQFVWAGTFVGWSGSTGNANGSSVTSKHLHLYYMTKDSVAPPGIFNGTKEDPAILFQAGTSVAAANKQKTHYPWVKGKVKNTYNEPFKREHVKIIAYDRSNGRVSPLTTTDASQTRIVAVTSPTDKGAFQLWIPHGLEVGLVVSRAYCPAAGIGDASDCNDVTLNIGPYAGDPKYHAEGEDLGTIKIEYRQTISGRIVQGGNPVANKEVEIFDKEASRTAGKVTTAVDGTFSAEAPAGRVQLKVGSVVKEVAARDPGTDHDVGDILI